jgi:hypothetical protein
VGNGSSAETQGFGLSMLSKPKIENSPLYRHGLRLSKL